MTMTDPIADMLTRIRNAHSAVKDEVDIPSSKLKLEIARILKQEGYIEDYEVVDPEDVVGKLLRIKLKYGSDRSKVIKGIQRVSTPGLRVYKAASELPKVLGGMGIAIISTSGGVMSDKEARRRRIGGEVVAIVW